MNLFGYELSLKRKDTLTQVPDNRGWISLIHESFPGAWQRNITIDRNLITSYYAVFSCMTLIASDIAKLRVLFLREKGKIFEEAKSPAYDPVLRNPNQMQNRIQFWESWILSKLTHGNTYVLKARDARRVVNRMWVLEPSRVKVVVSESGDVFYDLSQDNISGIRGQLVVPASEIIHDRMNTLFHPLVGLSPLYAAGLAATQGLAIQNNSTKFFTNRSIPGGIITSPNTIPDETAERIKRTWESRYGKDGVDQGGTAVMGDGLTFESMTMKATEAQMLEQLKWTAENVCSCFHVPPYKIGVGPLPSYNNVQALNVEYYSQAIQYLLEAAEECLLNGLEMKPGTRVQFDLDGLLRMDTAAQVVAIRDAVGSGVMSPNEGRAKLDLPPATGGESPYLQQQNYSLEALAKRDSQADPFATAAPPQPAAPEPEEEEDAGDGEEERQQRHWAFHKGLLSATA